MTTHVTVPLFYAGAEGWLDAGTSIVAGGSVLLADVEHCTHNHLHVCQYGEATPVHEIRRLISEGVTAAHQEAQAFMTEQFGDDWRSRASYSLGGLEYTQSD